MAAKHHAALAVEPMRRLRETMTDLGKAGAGVRVDRTAGMIYGVKIVGRASRNKRESKKGREYTEECLKKARRLYEGVSVRTNHKRIKDKDEDRAVEDVLGKLRNVRVCPDGLRGDLAVLKSHPMAERLFEAAESMPDAYGLSHDVTDWDAHFAPDGTYVVTDIRKLDSVDLVDRPGSTESLFESERRRTMKKKPVKPQRVKIETLCESIKDEVVKTAVASLIESAGLAGTMVTPSDDPAAAIGQAFLSAVCAVWTDPKADSANKLERLKSILAAQDQLVASGAVTPAGPPGEEEPEEVGGTEEVEVEDDEEDDEDKDMPKKKGKDAVAESLRAENEALKRKDACRSLCESMGVTPTPVQLKALALLDTDAERKQFLRESSVGSSAKKSGGTPDDVTDGKSLARKLRKR